MSGNIERIEAQKDMRALTIAVCAQGEEAAREHRERLTLVVGDIVRKVGSESVDSDPRNAKRDEQGWKELKAMAAAMGTLGS